MMEKEYTRREFLKTAGKGLSALALFSGPLRFFIPAQAEGEDVRFANALICGEEQLKVVFLERNNEEKSDSFLIMYLSEKGLDLTLHDGGLNDRQTYQALLNLREEILTQAGVPEADKAQYRLNLRIVISHFHMDHTEGLYGLIMRTNKKLHVSEAYLPPCAGLERGIYSDAHNGDLTHRPKFLAAMEKYHPDGQVHVLDFGETRLVPTDIGEVRVFAPVNDWSAPDKMLRFDHEYGYITSDRRHISLPQAATNANSVWLRVALGDYAFLFTGDVEKRLADRNDEAMDEIIAAYGEALRSDVIKYPHHGQVRNAAAAVIRDQLITDKAESVCILTAPNGRSQAGVALTDLGMPWIDLESGSIFFTVKDGKMTRKVVKDATAFL